MKMTTSLLIITSGLYFNAVYGQATDSLVTLTTPWTQEATQGTPLNEYPRPQMSRRQWTNLNGTWNYAIADSSEKMPSSFAGKILVPYPVESMLSGVKKPLYPNQRLWYQRTFQLKHPGKSERQLLHFGAVDFEANVYVNGRFIGNHTGGFQAFSFDITDACKEGKNEMIVSVLDPTDQGDNPRGKQVLHPEGIMYTATSGIWQTVWLETVPREYITSLIITPDIDKSLLHLTVKADAGLTAEATILAAGLPVSTTRGPAGSNLQLPVKDARLWSPSDPFLYDLKISLYKGDKLTDSVRSYFGMRKIEVKKAADNQFRFFLNNTETYHLGVLDQGFWPDGLYTAPTDSALLWDIQVIKQMGFNTIRKHIKIEPARWYYYCDKLGMLVWQDMPYPANLSMEGKKEFEKENAINITQLYNSPSIVCWVLFNEGWNRYDQQRLTEWIQQADTTRLINGHSGENYDRKAPKDITLRYVASDMTDIHDYPGPNIPSGQPGKARVLGEWGGVRVATPGHQWNPSSGWGYIESDAKDFERKYDFMMRHLKIYKQEGLSGSIYTEPFDVEIEENGLITYDRRHFKIPVEKLHEINSTFLQPGN